MATARIDLRLEEEIKAKAEKASALLGLTSLNDYVVSLIDEDATQVIKNHEVMQIEDSRFDEFIAACAKVQAPNQALIDAAKYTYESSIE